MCERRIFLLRFVLKMSFSPDARNIVYDFPPKENAEERDIFLLSTDGSREVPLVEHPANDVFPMWTPDGKTILFASDRTGTLGLWAIKVAEGRPLGSPEMLKPDIGRVLPMGITKTGAFYYGLQTQLNDVYIGELDLQQGKLVGSLTPLSQSQRVVSANFSPDWSPDGKYLAYVPNRGVLPEGFGSKQLSIRHLETGEERILSPKLSYISRPRWAPDGRSIFVNGKDMKNRQGLYKIDPQSGDVSVVLHSEPGTYVQWVECSPDGKTIFYNEGNPKGNRLVKRDLETGQETELLRGTVQDFAVSPDGQQLVFGFWDRATRVKSLRVISTAGGEPRELLRQKEGEDFIAGFQGLVWTPDGRSVLFLKGPANLQGETLALWRVSVERGESKTLGLAMNRLRHIRLHPDGRHIAFSAGKNKGEVWVMENFLPAAQARKASVSRR